MRIIVDVSEKKPWAFSPTVPVVRKRLVTGDYSIQGLEHVVRIERKGPDEIWSMVGSDRERFLAQLSRLGKFPIRALVIEGTLEDIIHRPGFSQVSYTNFVFRLMSWTTEACVPVWFLGKRCKATLSLIEEFFAAIYKNYSRTRGFTKNFAYKPLTGADDDGINRPPVATDGSPDTVAGHVPDTSGYMRVDR